MAACAFAPFLHDPYPSLPSPSLRPASLRLLAFACSLLPSFLDPQALLRAGGGGHVADDGAA